VPRADERPVFDRLAGLETEYAIRFHPRDPAEARPSNARLYAALVASVRRRVPVAEARHFKQGVFTANGGAVWFEAEHNANRAGLVEGSTPECRGPRQVLLYQRAQDQLLAEAAAATDLGGEFRLVKNDRDSRDNVYGAQENYEAVLARGAALWLWRAGLVALLPLALVTWLVVAVLFLVVFTGMLIGLAIYIPFSDRLERVTRLRRLWARVQESGWVEASIMWVFRVVYGPLAGGLWLLTWLAAFRQTRRQLLPFLASRAVIGGSGMLDRDGHFHLADKAPAINCLLGFGGFAFERPLFNFGHFFKTVGLEACFSPREYCELFASRQRLQIGLGDSNMAETAEYLRLGTTMLVLDVIEAGEMPRVPRLRRPLESMRAWCADPTLRTTVPLSGGRNWTALHVQRFYLDACRSFLNRRPDAPAEAWDIVLRWEEALDLLARLPRSLIGTLDWVSKKHFLDEAGDEVSLAARKKIDLRYHELSPEGYFSRLQLTDAVETLVEPDDVERAIRSAPAGTPATTRGYYIREFAEAGRLRVNWKRVVIGRGRKAKTVLLSRYGKAAASGKLEAPALRDETDDSERNDAGTA
jgi:proteasome accessory factor A